MAKFYGPKPDHLLVSKDAKKLRNNLTNFLPKIGLSMIDYGRCAEIDHFYNQCQNHRDYYKDTSGRIKPVQEFQKATKQFASKPEPTTVYVSQPLQYTIDRRPIIYSLTTGRAGRRPNNSNWDIDLSGTYNVTPCIKYKR